MNCIHDFSEPIKAKIVTEIPNPFCYIGSSDIRMLIKNEENGWERSCKKCSFTEFTKKTKQITVPDFD